MLKYYFAHPVSVYNTKLEEAIMVLIRHCFPRIEVVNPNTPDQQKAYKKERTASGGTHADHKGMDFFYRTVENCDGCTSMPFLDCRMGLGVASETQKALKAGKPAWLIEPSHELTQAEMDAFTANPLNGSFMIREFHEDEVSVLVNTQDLKANPPAFVVSHEETRLRTYLQYDGAMRPYAEAHKAKLPVPDDFYALDPKKK